MCTADEEMNIDWSDPRSYEHYWTSSWIGPGFEPSTFAIPVQRSINWANKPTGSWFLC